MNLYYEVIVKDRYGKLLAHLKQPARSWLKQWNQLIYGGMSGVAQSVLDTNGINRTQSVTYDLLKFSASPVMPAWAWLRVPEPTWSPSTTTAFRAR